MQEILQDLRAGEDRGTSRVGVKMFSVPRFGFWNNYIPLSLEGPPVAKAPIQNASDGEELKLGERTGLDTPVVPAVNYVDCGVMSE